VNVLEQQRAHAPFYEIGYLLGWGSPLQWIFGLTPA
jgi:hypothetical protein